MRKKGITEILKDSGETFDRQYTELGVYGKRFYDNFTKKFGEKHAIINGSIITPYSFSKNKNHFGLIILSGVKCGVPNLKGLDKELRQKEINK